MGGGRRAQCSDAAKPRGNMIWKSVLTCCSWSYTECSTCTRAMSWSELGVRKRNLELTPDLPKPCISPSSCFYSSPSSSCPAWPAPLTSALLLDSPLYLQSYLLLQTIVGFQQQPRAAGHFIKRWPHSAPSLNSRGLGPKWLGKSAGLEL